MIWDDQKSEMVQKILDRAKEKGAYAVIRLEKTSSKGVILNHKGEVESVQTNLQGGIGLQVFTPQGYHASGSSEGFCEKEALSCLDSLIQSAKIAGKMGLRPNTSLFDIPPHREEVIPARCLDTDEIPLAHLQTLIQEAHRELASLDSEVSLRSSATIRRRNWLIARSDGTWITFAQPYAYRRHTYTYHHNSDSHSKLLSSFSPDLSVYKEDFLPRALPLISTLKSLSAAPQIKSGSYPLLIDYALAKGLVHEAFGHAAEGDGMESSILGEKGRYKKGEKVAHSRVNVIDESIGDDNAYQPFSAQGLPREKAVIIEGGYLKDALADVFSAPKIGVPTRGSSRIESYRHIPLPRMSNIRLEWKGAHPLDKEDFYTITPGEIRQSIEKAGIFQDHEAVYLLRGYRGGQVNPVLGSFVFGCTSIWKLTPQGEELFQPAIFSGDTLGALEAISDAFGPLKLDALGTCGKSGQRVPSSGGSHFFLFIDRHPQIALGGKDK